MGILRIIGILFIVAKHRLDRLLPRNVDLPWWGRVILVSIRIIPAPKETPAVSLRKTFEELGPIFIKFGQILSTRRDLFNEESANELQKLQDRVPPFDPTLARQIVEESLEAPIESVFSEFSSEPLASASLAQVHAATLASGEAVVAKIIRPGIEPRIHRDLKVMYIVAHLMERIWVEGRRLHPVEVVEDYEHTILDELNLQLEAGNMARLRNNWQFSGKLYVPKVYWDYTSRNVMVMERVFGLTGADVEGMRARNVDMKKLAHLGVEIFFTQVFKDNFFHADMHPGNVFIDVSDPENPTYIALDCAIMGSLTEEDKNYLARNILAFFRRDYHEVARLHVESVWVPPDTDTREFEAVIRSVCEPVFQKPIKEISFGKVLLSLFQTARRFNMEVQPQLVLLQKTLLNIEGMGRQLYPDLDLWETAAPFMEDWMSDRIGVVGLAKRFGKTAPRLMELLPELPDLAVEALTEARQMSKNNREQLRLLNELNATLKAQAKDRRYSKLGGMALVAALLAALVPLTGYAATTELFVGSGLLGSLGVYWMFIKP